MVKITRRTQLRETAFLILFRANCYCLTEMPAQIKSFFVGEDEYKEDEIAYITNRVLAVCEKIPEIDEQLDKFSIGWKTKRMNLADLTALRLAYYEIVYDADVPNAAAINEAVELAKNYGTDNSSSFVNGILAKVAQNAGE